MTITIAMLFNSKPRSGKDPLKALLRKITYQSSVGLLQSLKYVVMHTKVSYLSVILLCIKNPVKRASRIGVVPEPQTNMMVNNEVRHTLLH